MSTADNLKHIVEGESVWFKQIAYGILSEIIINEHSNNVVHVCATNKRSVQPAHTRRLIRAFAKL